MAMSKVLSPQVVRDEKYKVDEALTYSKAKLVDTRTDERRKVCCLIIHEAHAGYNFLFQCLGKHPYPRHKFMPTKELAASIIHSMGGVSDGDLLNVYCHHLALFMCIIILFSK